MFEIYLLTLLDGIKLFFSLIGTITLIIASIAFIVIVVNEALLKSDTSSYIDSHTREKRVKLAEEWRPRVVKLIITSIVVVFINCLIPSTKEAYIIFGVGTAIEYARGNETLKELPDKAVMCFDKFLDEYIDDDTDVNTSETPQQNS